MPPVMEAPLAMDCYEDMFKEITRKLYGEDDNMNSNPRSITAEYDHTTGGFKSEDGGALAAFGLAALMQNGFPPPPPPPHAHPQDRWVCSEENLPWTTSKVASYNPVQRVFRCAECDSVGSLARVAEHWLGAHANLRVFQCPQCPYSSAWARCVRMHLSRQHNVSEDSLGPLHKESPALQEVSKFLHRLRARAESGPPPPPAPSAPPPPPPPTAPPPTAPKQENSGGVKRYCCGFCPYATDRRDLFTRHENIHRAEKPFQCYVCQKQFNRADHVKKHFLRMHRDYPYDLNRIRRQPPKNASGMSYYHKYNNNTTSSSSGTNNSNNGNSNNGGRPQDNHHMLSMPHPPPIHQGHLHPGLNIPGGFPPMGIRSGSNGVGKQKSSHGGCNAKSHGGKMKKKGEKRYSCCYCAWSGVDNWCLKRHLNTHLKPFVCVLCDYKAARSERLATHVLKVHNKRSCGRCSFLADDQAQLTIHLQEHHPLEHRNNRSSNNVLRNVGFSNHPPPGPTPFGYQTSDMVKREHMDTNLGGPLYGAEGVHCPRRQHWGAARLFHYMEASDASDEGEEMEQEEVELPEFVCRECGCEFVDDASLETHNMTHHRVSSSAEERAATTCNSSSNHCAYQCSVCGHGMGSQTAMMDHMKSHSSICNEARAGQETHRDTNLLRCPHCSIALVTYEDIRQHREQHHNLETCVNCDNMARKHYADSIMDSNMNHQKVGDQKHQ
uniref:C2H2-type domain-containing protein n=1 Tax=Timema shepardi TaxID=629360 RepID=A0A7R9AWS2_TIMSH|nr:unnamed protein product [Timema shepardi]